MKTLHASKIGFPCKRNLWFSANGYDPDISERTQRIFDVGSALEPVVVQWLRNDGWTVEYNQGSQNAEIEVQIDVLGGFLIGHHDCIISRLDGLQNVLVDIKTMNNHAFSQWKKEGSVKNKPQYVKQLHVYAMGLQNIDRTIEHLGIVGVNKNNSDIHIDIFDFDEHIAQDIRDNAESIFALSDAPTDDSPTETWCCSYCEFAGSCDLRSQPHYSNGDKELPPAVSESEAVIEAMQSLLEARELAKKAKAMKDEAKNILDENIRQQGLTSLQAGNYICTVSQSQSTRFDSAAFKKAHPDLVAVFSKTSPCLLFDVKEV